MGWKVVLQVGKKLNAVGGGVFSFVSQRIV